MLRSIPTCAGCKTQAGDYVESQLADRMDVAKLVGDIVTHWHKFGERRKTVAFAVNVAHSLHIRDEFVRSGVRCEHLDGETEKDERDAILARLASGETEVVTNCMVLTEGWDMPEVGCAILARPTKKMGLYRQMIGRVLRPADGKPDAIILDHSGAVYRHGLAEDPVRVDARPREAGAKRRRIRRALNREAPKLLECSQCSALRLAGEKCPHCGFLPKRPPRDVPTAPGELGLYAGGRAQIVCRRSRHAHALARHAHAHRQRARLQARMDCPQVQGKVRRVPALGQQTAADPADTRGLGRWVRSRTIAFARSRTGT